MGDIFESISASVLGPRLEKQFKQAIEDATKESMKKYTPILAKHIEAKYRAAVQEFYSEGPYGVDGSLYDIMTIKSATSSGNTASIFLNYNEDIEKPSWHYARLSSDGSRIQIGGYPENIYQSVFMEGYHGGRGASHSLWGWGTAAQASMSPYDSFHKKVKELAASDTISKEFQWIFYPIAQKKVRSISIF